MKHTFLILIFAANALAIPQIINYQGQLTGTTGSALDTTVAMTFSLYGAPGGGTPMWTETQPSVQVTDGHFSVLLGTFTVLPDSFLAERFLGIRIGSDTEMTPRHEFASAAYAFRVGTVDGAKGGSISGSLSAGQQNTIGTLNAVALGRQNVASGHTAMSFGRSNMVRGDFSVIAGGGGTGTGIELSDSNSIAGNYSSILGGRRNRVSGDYGAMGGGSLNLITRSYATIGGGTSNDVTGNFATVSGGQSNQSDGEWSSIGGGRDNDAFGDYASIAGGWNNAASGQSATVAGGQDNSAAGQHAVVGGGLNNESSASFASVCGGDLNIADDIYAHIGGGIGNLASDTAVTISGGRNNGSNGRYATIGGGDNNAANGSWATIAGGFDNSASASWTAIPGGYQNLASAQYAVAMGRYARAINTNSFVFSAGGDTTQSFGVNTFTARAPGGVRFYTDASATNVGASLAAGSGTWSALSDRNVKENFEAVNTSDVLKKIEALEISRWNYKTQDDAIRHIGPMAQDFHAAFAVGENNTTITTVDADGVLFAAIQELLKRNLELEARIKKLEGESHP
jgi:hypothetical protein